MVTLRLNWPFSAYTPSLRCFHDGDVAIELELACDGADGRWVSALTVRRNSSNWGLLPQQCRMDDRPAAALVAVHKWSLSHPSTDSWISATGAGLVSFGSAERSAPPVPRTGAIPVSWWLTNRNEE